MTDLITITREEVEKYAGNGRGANVILFPLIDNIHQTYAVTAVDYPTREDIALILVLARIVGDKVVIQEDTTDKKLVDALMQRGIPRNQIVLAYNGEPIPDAEKYELKNS